jgi:hypothetical protein
MFSASSQSLGVWTQLKPFPITANSRGVERHDGAVMKRESDADDSCGIERRHLEDVELMTSSTRLSAQK